MSPPSCSCPWENLSSVFSVSSQKYVWVSSCITNALLHLHAASPSVFAGTSVCPISPHLIRYCCPCASGHFSCHKFPHKGTVMKRCFSPRLVFIIPLQLLFSKLSPLTAAWTGGCCLLAVRYPWASEAVPAPRMDERRGCRRLHLTRLHETEIPLVLQGPQFCSCSCLFLNSVSR